MVVNSADRHILRFWCYSAPVKVIIENVVKIRNDFVIYKCYCWLKYKWHLKYCNYSVVIACI